MKKLKINVINATQQQAIKENALLRACNLSGGQRRLAAIIRVSSSRMNNWLNRGDAIPYHFALLIETATKQQVTREQLCPDKTVANQIMRQNLLSKPDAASTYCQHKMVPLEKVRLHKRLAPFQRTSLPMTDEALSRPIILDTQCLLLVGKALYAAHQQHQQHLLPAITLDITALIQQRFNLDKCPLLLRISERLAIGAYLEMCVGNHQGQRYDLYGYEVEEEYRGTSMTSLTQNFVEVTSKKEDRTTCQHVAQCIGLSRESFRQGKIILRQGIAALIMAIDNKQLPLYKAARLAKLSPVEQQQQLMQIL